MNQKVVCSLVGAIALVAGSVFAEELTTQPYVDENAGKILDIEKTVQDIHGNSHLVSYQVFVNPTGGYTAITNSRSNNLKAIHEEMCEARGEKDAWDAMTYTFPANTEFPMLCWDRIIFDTLEEFEEYKRMEKKLSEGEITQQEFEEYEQQIKQKQENTEATETEKLTQSSSVEVKVPSTRFPKDTMYFINGKVEYIALSSGEYSYRMYQTGNDSCLTRASGYMSKNSYGRDTVTLNCNVPRPGVLMWSSDFVQL